MATATQIQSGNFTLTVRSGDGNGALKDPRTAPEGTNSSSVHQTPNIGGSSSSSSNGSVAADAQPQDRQSTTPQGEGKEKKEPPTKGAGGGTRRRSRTKNVSRWTEEQDRLLTEAVQRHGPRNWKRIATEIGGMFTADQCNQHWHRVLNPRIVKGDWSPAEDELLYERVTHYGESSWTKVSEGIPGRTDIQCRHRFYQRKREEEEKLKESSGKSKGRRKKVRKFEADGLPITMSNSMRDFEYKETGDVDMVNITGIITSHLHYQQDAIEEKSSEAVDQEPELMIDEERLTGSTPNKISQNNAADHTTVSSSPPGIDLMADEDLFVDEDFSLVIRDDDDDDDDSMSAAKDDSTKVSSAEQPQTIGKEKEQQTQEKSKKMDSPSSRHLITVLLLPDAAVNDRIRVSFCPGPGLNLPSTVHSQVDKSRIQKRILLPFSESEDRLLQKEIEKARSNNVNAQVHPKDYDHIITTCALRFHPLRNARHLEARYKQILENRCESIDDDNICVYTNLPIDEEEKIRKEMRLLMPPPPQSSEVRIRIKKPQHPYDITMEAPEVLGDGTLPSKGKRSRKMANLSTDEMGKKKRKSRARDTQSVDSPNVLLRALELIDNTADTENRDDGSALLLNLFHQGQRELPSTSSSANIAPDGTSAKGRKRKSSELNDDNAAPVFFSKSRFVSSSVSTSPISINNENGQQSSTKTVRKRRKRRDYGSSTVTFKIRMDSREPTNLTGLQAVAAEQQLITVAGNTTMKQLEAIIKELLDLADDYKLQLLMDQKILQQHITIMSVMQAYDMEEDDLIICYRTHPRKLNN